MRCLDDETSEDDHPSTDASEDSVDVSVKPVSRPHSRHHSTHNEKSSLSHKTQSQSLGPLKIYKKGVIDTYEANKGLSYSAKDFNPVPKLGGLPIERRADICRLPRKFRKAYDKEGPIDFSVTSLTTSPDPPQRCSSPESQGELLPPRCGSPESQGELLPPTCKGNRRKPSEPRRVVEQVAGGVKRPNEDVFTPRKVQRGESNSSPRTEVQPHKPQPNPLIGHNPFVGHFASPHLLLPPAWPPVARFPYSHLVGSMLGPPLGFLPTPPYPLLPILSPRETHFPKQEQNVEDEKPIKLNGISPYAHIHSSLPPQIHPLHLATPPSVPLTNATSPISRGRGQIHKHPSHKKFHSVESLLNNAEPKTEPLPLNCDDVSLPKDGSSPPSVQVSQPRPSTSFQPHSSTSFTPSADDERSIQSLLHSGHNNKSKQRNYKNMTRERRIEANARERTRVHTISAAFETLRGAIPSFSHNQKLSKLSVLRIASTYILSLARLAGHDYSEDGSNPSFEECVDLCTKTIQVEGKAKKKREE